MGPLPALRAITRPMAAVALAAASLGIMVGAGATAAPAGAAVLAGQPEFVGGFERTNEGGEAFGINDAGSIVGDSPTASSDETPFLFDAATQQVVELPEGPETWWARARAINNGGTIVGQLNLSDAWIATRPAIWSAPQRELASVGDLGGDFGFAYDISDGGIVVGDASMPRGEDPNVADSHAFVSDPTTGTLIDIGTLPGGASSTARAINEAGVVVGTSDIGGTAPCLADPSTTCGATHAFTYDRHTRTRIDIGTLPGGTSSEATSINEHGVVVGSSLVPGPGGTTETHPFTYDIATATFHDLGVIPGATALRANAVNDDGVIVGNIGHAGGWAFDPADSTITALPGVERLNDVNNHGTAVGSGLVPAGVDPDDQPLPGFVVGSIRVQLQVTPSAPLLVRASSCSGPVDLLWTAPVSAGYSATPTYRVHRDGVPIATTATRSFRDVGGAAGASYAIQTVNDAGASALGPPLVASCAPAINGTVTAEGLPVAGIDVRVYPFGTAPVVAKTTTAADGTYAIGGLAPGDYQVRFSSPTNAYVLEWNGGGGTRAQAPPVTVSAVPAVVDAALKPPGSVHGTVSSAGVPVAGIDVRVYPAGGGLAVARTVTAADGTYQVASLPAGDYKIRFSSPTAAYVLQWNGGVSSAGAASPVAVSPTTAATVDASLVLAATVTGRFEAWDGFSGQWRYPGGVEVRIYPIGSSAVAKTTTGSDGRFTVVGLPPGSYRVRMSDPLGRFGGIGWLAEDPVDPGSLLLVPTSSAATTYTLTGGQAVDVGTLSV